MTLAAGIGLFLRDGAWAVWQVVFSNLGFLALLLPKVVAGLFVAAAIPILIPRDWVVRALGRDSGWRGLTLTTIAGAVVPGGPVMIFALSASLLSSGAHLSTLLAFVTSWSLLGLNRTIIWELSFLSADFVALRYLMCLPAPFLVGLWARWMIRT